jgi:hypothetical protein
MQNKRGRQKNLIYGQIDFRLRSGCGSAQILLIERMQMIDFDESDIWNEQINQVLSDFVDETVKQKLKASTLKDIEDVRDLFFSLTDREKVIDTTLKWLLSSNVVGYHGSRLTDDEVLAIQKDGLVPLNAENRKKRLIRTLSKHSEWLEIEPKLVRTIQKYREGGYIERREGQVHLTLSRAGLINSFNHYLYYGSEFDQRVASKVLGNEGKELLKQDGVPRIIQISVPGSLALSASHPYFSIEDTRKKGEIPNVVEQFITAWAFKIKNTSFQSKTLDVDCGMIFYNTVPSSWIINIETIADL